jgi:hypothetical protein
LLRGGIMRKLLFFFVLLAACGGSSATIDSANGDGGSGTGNAAGCPSTAPTAGATCSIEGLKCTYACEDERQPAANCATGRWNVTFSRTACTANPPPPPTHPFACGTQTCGENQYCIHPCCGGPAPGCDDVPASGTCPTGTHSAVCAHTGKQGCEQDACKPDPPYCIDDPKKAPNCGDGMADNHDISCMCA